MDRMEIVKKVQEAQQGSRSLIITVTPDAGRGFARHLIRCVTDHNIISIPQRDLWTVGKAVERGVFTKDRTIVVHLTPDYELIGLDLFPDIFSSKIESIQVPAAPAVQQ